MSKNDSQKHKKSSLLSLFKRAFAPSSASLSAAPVERLPTPQVALPPASPRISPLDLLQDPVPLDLKRVESMPLMRASTSVLPSKSSDVISKDF
ncbi:hypothetical protein HDU91_002080, partial [Kappamyces sp. JEL0680]